ISLRVDGSEFEKDCRHERQNHAGGEKLYKKGSKQFFIAWNLFVYYFWLVISQPHCFYYALLLSSCIYTLYEFNCSSIIYYIIILFMWRLCESKRYVFRNRSGVFSPACTGTVKLIDIGLMN